MERKEGIKIATMKVSLLINIAFGIIKSIDEIETTIIGKVPTSVKLAIPTSVLEVRSPSLTCMTTRQHKIHLHVSLIITRLENRFSNIIVRLILVLLVQYIK